MSIIANTFQTYQAKGIREELSDVISNIAPTETPFQSNAGSSKVSNTFFEWQTDTLANTAANAQIEGDDVSALDAVVPTVRIGNYTQISRKTVVIAGTEEVVNKAGRKSELAYQLAKKGQELKRDREAIFLANTAAAAGATGTARNTGSLLAYIKTNVNKASDGANPTYTTVPNATRTDGTLRNSSETLLKDAIQQAWSAGAEPKVIMVGALQKQAISGFAGIATKTKDIPGKNQAVIVGAADVYVSDFGVLTVMPNRFQRARDMFVLDFDYIEIGTLRPYQTVELAKTGDAEKRMIIVEYGLKVKNEAALALVADVQ